MRILQVSFSDRAGGAEKVAWDLFQAYRRRGHESWLVVGHKHTNAPFVWELDHDDCRRGLPYWLAILWKPFRKFETNKPWLRSLRRRSLFITDHRRVRNWLAGFEDFEFPATGSLLNLPPTRPDVVHCHNLHGNYFDLRELAVLSHEVPVILTMHDAWLLSGHCAHSFDCERWKTGCGRCPDLTIPAAIRQDATAYNWRRKREIYAKSRLYVVTPSQWLMRKVEQSILAPAVVEARIIPYGVDLSIFRPADKKRVRTALGIPQDAKLLFFAAIGSRHNIWKDFQTLRAAVAIIAERMYGQNVIFISMGEDAPVERIGQAEFRFVPYQKDPEAVARYYQAADVYLHAAKADNFPLAIIEASACGIPVVATAVGGIPELVEDGVTGYLVPRGDAAAMAERIRILLKDSELRYVMSQRAAERATRLYDLERQVNDYLNLYAEVTAGYKAAKDSR
jgi:glycosyltransferase involved in cell wall biosynthesis